MTRVAGRIIDRCSSFERGRRRRRPSVLDSERLHCTVAQATSSSTSTRRSGSATRVVTCSGCRLARHSTSLGSPSSMRSWTSPTGPATRSGFGLRRARFCSFVGRTGLRAWLRSSSRVRLGLQLFEGQRLVFISSDRRHRPPSPGRPGGGGFVVQVEVRERIRGDRRQLREERRAHAEREAERTQVDETRRRAPGLPIVHRPAADADSVGDLRRRLPARLTGAADGIRDAAAAFVFGQHNGEPNRGQQVRGAG